MKNKEATLGLVLVKNAIFERQTRKRPSTDYPLAHEVRPTKQIILRNCGLIIYPSCFDSKDSLRG